MVTIISLIAPVVLAVVLTVVLLRLLGTRPAETPVEHSVNLNRDARVSPAHPASATPEPRPAEARRVA